MMNKKSKSELRAFYLQKRKKLTVEQRQFLSQKIIENFILQFKPTENQKVHCFLPIGKFAEIDTFPLMNYCFEQGIRFFVPKMIASKLIAVEVFPDTQLHLNKWGIPEPQSDIDAEIKDFDFVITPLLYCDQYGNRVGYGKGFYDELFDCLSESSKKIGVSFFPPCETISDIREEDIPLDYLIVPSSVFSFKIGL